MAYKGSDLKTATGAANSTGSSCSGDSNAHSGSQFIGVYAGITGETNIESWVSSEFILTSSSGGTMFNSRILGNTDNYSWYSEYSVMQIDDVSGNALYASFWGSDILYCDVIDPYNGNQSFDFAVEVK